MTTTRRIEARRAGFTIIELLVVIAIIAILMGLIASAVFQALRKGPETQTRVEIGQLEVAVEAFKQKTGAEYIPSKLRVCRSKGTYGLPAAQTQLDKDSIAFISKYIGKNSQSFDAAWSAGISWNSNNTGDETLEGEQVLVFCLGGYQLSTGSVACLGFSSNPTNMSVPNTPDRIGPFFEFKSDRLVPPAGKTYFAYVDPFGKNRPYAYFSSYGVQNGYNRYGTSDCATLGVWPYQSTQGIFLKPNSYQIISAGADGQFGPGTVTGAGAYFWNKNTWMSIPQNGRDDLANFAPGQLSKGE